MCSPALVFLILWGIILTITMSLTLWNLFLLFTWFVAIQFTCSQGYSQVAWGLLFLPFILWIVFQI
jgi:hypothetical protein